MQFIEIKDNRLLQSDIDINNYNELVKLIYQYPFNYSKHILRDQSLKQWVFNKTSKLIDSENFQYNISTRCFWICTGMTEFPVCATCGNTIGEFRNIKVKSGYPKFCSNECVGNNSEIQERKKNTCFDNFGVNWPMQSSEIKEKSEHTCMAIYGVKYASQADEVKKTIKESFIEHYGVDNNMKSDEGYRVYQNSIIEKYGVTNVAKSDSSKKKSVDTCLERYGVEYPMQSNEIIMKGNKRYQYDNQKFDSKQEIAFYIWLKDHNIDFEYHTSKALTYECDGIQHKYFPDFYLTYADALIEIKCNKFFNDDGMIQVYGRNDPSDVVQKRDRIANSKLKCMKQNKVYIMLDNSPEMKSVMNYITKNYGKDYLKQFKNNEA